MCEVTDEHKITLREYQENSKQTALKVVKLFVSLDNFWHRGEGLQHVRNGLVVNVINPHHLSFSLFPI